MTQTVVRPSMKLIRAAYTFVFSVFFFCVLAWVNWQAIQSWPAWVLVVPALLLIWPARSHVRRSFTKMTLLDDKLRYETGVLSKTTRNIQVAKIQDVRVDQSLSQRLLGTGNLSIETAGETSLLTIPNIDDPHAVAEKILEAASRHAQKGKS